MAEEIAKGLEFLHRHKVIHQDVKAANVLIDGDLHCKIGDLSLVSIEGTDDSVTLTLEIANRKSQEFHPAPRAPEQVNALEDVGYAQPNPSIPYTRATDVYAYGYCFLDLMAIEAIEEINLVTDSKEKIAIALKHLDEVSRHLFDSCTSEDPEDRPSMPQIVVALHEMLKTSATKD